MRRDDDVVEIQQRGSGGRLADEHVEAGAGDALRLERRVERVLVDDPAAAGVDDAQGRLRERELLGADEARGVRRLGDVDGDEVGDAHQLVEREELHAELLRASRRDVGVVRDERGAEAREALRDERADAAEADDADGLLVELHSREGRALPEALLERRARVRDEPGEREDVADRELGGRDDVRGRRVHDHDARGGRGLDVDVVEADARAGDHLQARGRGDGLRVDLRRGADEHGVRLREGREQGRAVGAVDGSDVEVGPQGVDGGGREFFGDEHYGLGQFRRSFGRGRLGPSHASGPRMGG